MTEIEYFDYVKCPVFYDAVHRKKLPFSFQPTMGELLNRVASQFFLKLMDGKIMPMSEIKKSWDRVCNSNKFISEKKCLEGISALGKMFLWAKDQQLRILDVKMPYRIRFDTTTDITGEINAIAVNQQDTPELLYMDFSQKMPDQSMLDMKLKYTLDSYAFKTSYEKDICAHIHNVKNDKEFFSYRSRIDFERAKDSIMSVKKAIENNIYYPRESAFCAVCEMKVFCRQWRIDTK